MRHLRVFLLISAISISCGAQVPPEKIAPSPPMGWNSWDSYGLTITEEQFRANAKVMAEKLKTVGYTYAVIDEGWFFFNPEDRPTPATLHYSVDVYGRYAPVTTRFPSAMPGKLPEPVPSRTAHPDSEGPKLAVTVENTSFKPLADWVHSQGLKFGIHIVRGIPRVAYENDMPIWNSSFSAREAGDPSDACPWDPTNWGVRNNAAGQAWYDSIISQYAEWGVDLLKVDCIANNPYKIDEIRMIRRSINKTGRSMILSLSPGPTAPEHSQEVRELANMWRISNDFWDVWADNPNYTFPQGLHGQFDRAKTWSLDAEPGHWPDADMLPLGHLGPVPGWGKPRDTRLTPAEQQAVMTLWAMARSPLIIGSNLTELDNTTFNLLTNSEMLAIDQTAVQSREVSRSGSIIAWTADLPPGSRAGSHALAFFNIGDEMVNVTGAWDSYGLGHGPYRVRDVWEDKDFGEMKDVRSVNIPSHGAVLWVLQQH